MLIPSHLSSTKGVWGLILALIIFTALLSVWFSDRHTLARKRYTHRRIIDASNPTKLRKWVYVRLALDDFIQKGTVSIVIRHQFLILCPAYLT